MTSEDYPLERTCGSCAYQGPVRVAGDAYVCQSCEGLHNAAVLVAANAAGVTVNTAHRVVGRYLAAMAES